MNRTLLLDSPFLLGFDRTQALIERAAKAAGEGYPPTMSKRPAMAGCGSPWRWRASRRPSST